VSCDSCAIVITGTSLSCDKCEFDLCQKCLGSPLPPIGTFIQSNKHAHTLLAKRQTAAAVPGVPKNAAAAPPRDPALPAFSIFNKNAWGKKAGKKEIAPADDEADRALALKPGGMLHPIYFLFSILSH
jgi:hypothetical protein